MGKYKNLTYFDIYLQNFVPIWYTQKKTSFLYSHSSKQQLFESVLRKSSSENTYEKIQVICMQINFFPYNL